MKRNREVHRAVAAAVASGLGFFAAGTAAVAAQAVVVTGVQVDYGDRVNRNPGSAIAGGGIVTVDDVCASSPAIGMALQQMLNQFEQAASGSGSPISLYDVQSIPGAPNRHDIQQDLSNARDAICDNPEPQTTAQAFTITYTSCRMSMFTPTHAMVINIRPGDGAAYMLVADHATREIVHKNLTASMDQVSQTLGSGWSDTVEMRSLGETAEIFGYDTEHYSFEYTSGLGEAGLGPLTQADVESGAISSPQALGNLVSVTSSGTAWMSDSAPGIDIVRSFYQNLTSKVQADEANSFLGGMIRNLVGMLDKGIPIVIEQTVESKVMGRTTISGKSESHVANIRLWDLYPGWCGDLEMPAGYTVTNLDEQMSETMSGENAPSAAEMDEAMRQYSEAMQQMTPEQRQMMEQLGLGNMAPSAPAAGSAAPQSARPASGAGAGSAMPSSEELHSENLTQMIQNHLQALGYDTGGTGGELTLETTIAISQFQAEKGLEVTGEVSPQLAGLLSAEVDKRRGN